MKEQNENKQENGAKKKRKRLTGEKRFYLFTAIACALLMTAIVAVSVVVTNSGNEQAQIPSGGNPSQDSSNGDTTTTPGDEENNENVVVTPEGMIAPVLSVSVLNEHGFYYNQTIGAYYEHTGIDFAAQPSAEVFAVEDGVVESVYKSDLLLGTQIVIRHDDGLKTLYRFVEEKEGLQAGDSVKKGDVIATVAEANGNEYKDGAHLHFEIYKDGVAQDPTSYLTLEEK